MASAIYRTFPNLSGKHLTLKLYNNSNEAFMIEFSRMKMHKYLDREDDKNKFPNLSGHHLTLKFYNSGNEAFALYYLSSKMLPQIL